MNNIVLIGYRGSGKTTVGRLLAERLDCALLDTDERIVDRAGMSIADIFATNGESAFRDLEAEIIAEASARSAVVLSVGGGAVLRDDNVRRLRDCGMVFWLDADAETLWSRIAGDEATDTSRPALTDKTGLDEVRQLLGERRAQYERCAHHRIPTADRTPTQVADAIEVLTARTR